MNRMLFILLALSMATSAAAQPAPGTHNGLWVGMFNQSVGLNYVLTLDAQGKPTPYATQAHGPWPYWGNPFGVCMFPDNTHLVVPAFLDNLGTTFGLALWDVTLPGVSGLLWQGPISGGQLSNYADLSMNSDGEVVTIDNQTTPQSVHCYDPTAKTWASRALPTSTRTSGGALGIRWDRLNGGWVWGAWGPPTELYRSAPDWSTTQVLATGPTSTLLGRYGGDLVQTGDFFASTCCSYAYYVVRSGTSSFTPGPSAALNVCYDITAEHYAKPGVGFWATVYNPPRGVQHIDPTTTPPTVTGIFTGSSTTMPTAPIEVAPFDSNDLNTVRTSQATWRININPGRGLHSLKNFIIAASLTGATMIPLADGREIFLSPDIVTLTSVAGFFPFLQGNLGQLDAFGVGQATLDLSSLVSIKGQVNGTVLHLAGVVLDAAAPGGVAHVCQPWAFVVNIR